MVVLWALAAALVLLGIVGLFVPGLPGPPLIWAGVFVLAAAHGFERISVLTVILLGVLVLVAWGAELAASALGARKLGASKWGVVGAIAGTVVGLFLGLPGLLFGPLVGAILGELASRRPQAEAVRAGFGAVLGLLGGAVVKFTTSFVVIAVAALAHFAWNPP